MTPRARKQGNGTLPVNLYANMVKGRVYYNYIHPQTKRKHSLGTNRLKAIKRAKLLNEKTMPDEDIAVMDKVLGRGALTVEQLIDRYEKERVPKKNWKAKTKSNMLSYLRRYKREFGKRYAASVDTKFIYDWLVALNSDNAYIKHKSLFEDIFRFAKSVGVIDENPATDLLKVDAPERVRERLTKKEFDEIYKKAEDWVQVAMDLFLVTLLRPVDLVRLKYDDIRDGHLLVSLAKTESYKKPVHLAIKMTPQLDAIVARSRKDGILSPYIIHRLPQRKVLGKRKDHWSQVLENYLGEAFRAARDEAGVKEELPLKQRPTLYEIRALGGHIYETELGWEPEEVQALMGHSTVKMTNDYLVGHKVTYKEVKATMSL